MFTCSGYTRASKSPDMKCFIAFLLFIFFSIVTPNDFCLPGRYYYFLYSLSTEYRRLTEIKITSRMAYLPPQHFLNMKKVFGKQPYTSVFVTSSISKYYDYNRTFSYFASMKTTATPRDSLSLRKCLTRTGRRKRQSRTLNSQQNQKTITTSINRQY